MCDRNTANASSFQSPQPPPTSTQSCQKSFDLENVSCPYCIFRETRHTDAELAFLLVQLQSPFKETARNNPWICAYFSPAYFPPHLNRGDTSDYISRNSHCCSPPIFLLLPPPKQWWQHVTYRWKFAYILGPQGIWWNIWYGKYQEGRSEAGKTKSGLGWMIDFMEHWSRHLNVHSCCRLWVWNYTAVY